MLIKCFCVHAQQCQQTRDAYSTAQEAPIDGATLVIFLSVRIGHRHYCYKLITSRFFDLAIVSESSCRTASLPQQAIHPGILHMVPAYVDSHMAPEVLYLCALGMPLFHHMRSESQVLLPGRRSPSSNSPHACLMSLGIF